MRLRALAQFTNQTATRQQSSPEEANERDYQKETPSAVSPVGLSNSHLIGRNLERVLADMWDPSSDGQTNKGGGEGQKEETHASYIYSCGI